MPELEDEREEEDDDLREAPEEDLDLELELIFFDVVPREELREEGVFMDLLPLPEMRLKIRPIKELDFLVFILLEYFFVLIFGDGE